MVEQECKYKYEYKCFVKNIMEMWKSWELGMKHIMQHEDRLR